MAIIFAGGGQCETKGFYNDDNDWTGKIKEFLKESGFYILVVIGLCVLAVGAVYFTTNHLISSPEQYEDDLVPTEHPLKTKGPMIMLHWMTKQRMWIKLQLNSYRTRKGVLTMNQA